MFDIGWSEMMVVGVVALIVIGPKDLPDMFRTVGRFTAKARGMAREFSRAMESAADETGVKDVAKDLRNIASPKSMGLDAIKGAAAKFESWDPMKKPSATTKAQPDPDAPKPAAPDEKFMGPATQALADQQAAKRAAAAQARAIKAEMAADLADAAPSKPARAKAAPKVAAAKVAAAAAAKPAPRPATRKPAAKKPTAQKPTAQKPAAQKGDA